MGTLLSSQFFCKSSKNSLLKIIRDFTVEITLKDKKTLCILFAFRILVGLDVFPGFLMSFCIQDIKSQNFNSDPSYLFIRQASNASYTQGSTLCSALGIQGPSQKTILPSLRSCWVLLDANQSTKSYPPTPAGLLGSPCTMPPHLTALQSHWPLLVPWFPIPSGPLHMLLPLTRRLFLSLLPSPLPRYLSSDITSLETCNYSRSCS